LQKFIKFAITRTFDTVFSVCILFWSRGFTTVDPFDFYIM